MGSDDLVTTGENDEKCMEFPLEALEESDYNPYSFTPKKQQIFLREFSKTCNASKAARVAGIPKTTALEARDRCEVFDTFYNQAEEFAFDKLESEAYRRAKDGRVIAEQYDDDGNVTQRRKTYSDKLMTELLRSHKPQKYEHKEEKEHNITIEWQGPGAAQLEDGDE